MTFTDDNFELCGAYHVTLLTPYSWLTYSHSPVDHELSVSVSVTDPQTVAPDTKTAVFKVSLADYPAAPSIQVILTV